MHKLFKSIMAEVLSDPEFEHFSFHIRSETSYYLSYQLIYRWYIVAVVAYVPNQGEVAISAYKPAFNINVHGELLLADPDFIPKIKQMLLKCKIQSSAVNKDS